MFKIEDPSEWIAEAKMSKKDKKGKKA